MRIAILTIAFVLSLFESTVLPFPVTLLWVIVLSLVMGDKASYTAFAAGLSLDFLTGRILGLDAVVFLAVNFLISRYRKRFNTINYLYISLFSAVSVFIYAGYFYKNTGIVYLAVSVVVSFLLYKSVSVYFPEIISDRKKLSL